MLSLELGQQQQYPLALEKRTSRDMSLRTLRINWLAWFHLYIWRGIRLLRIKYSAIKMRLSGIVLYCKVCQYQRSGTIGPGSLPLPVPQH
jgi:hypothetical protein